MCGGDSGSVVNIVVVGSGSDCERFLGIIHARTTKFGNVYELFAQWVDHPSVDPLNGVNHSHDI